MGWELREEYRGYKPYSLAKVRGMEMLYEFISFPWRESDEGRVLINARPINQSASMRTFECRREISPTRWSGYRERAYKQGFQDGVAWAIQTAKELAKEKTNAT
jgi:hypothetical protein